MTLHTIDTTPASPNHSSRDGALIRMITMHATVGSYASSLAWLCNPASKASAHYLIRKDGYINQLIDVRDAAWHAGKSAWRGLDSLEIMQCSIGIELENQNTGHDPYPVPQLDAAIWLCKNLIARYAIVPDMVVTHAQIATPKGRKTDPKGFPWAVFEAALYPSVTRYYRAITCAPVFQDRRPDAPLALAVTAGAVELIDDVTAGWVHLESDAGFSPLSCWEIV